MSDKTVVICEKQQGITDRVEKLAQQLPSLDMMRELAIKEDVSGLEFSMTIKGIEFTLFYGGSKTDPNNFQIYWKASLPHLRIGSLPSS